MSHRRILLALVLLASVSCSGGAGTRDAAVADSGVTTPADGGDADASPADSGEAPDPDAGSDDAGADDAGVGRDAATDAGLAPPVAAIACTVGSGSCGDPNVGPPPCIGLSFGTVAAADAPCDLVVEVRNDAPAAAAELVVERVEVQVQDINDGQSLDGASAGFSVRDANGAPLVIDSAAPLIVPPTDARRFVLRFDGARTGLFRGEARTGTGLRLYTSDPTQPLLTVPLTAIGSAPNIEVIPARVDFGPVAQGSSAREVFKVFNFGDTTLDISSIRLVSANPEFTVTTSRGSLTGLSLTPIEQIDVIVDFAPTDAGPDVEAIEIVSNDLRRPVTTVPVVAGGVPRISVNPLTMLPFSGQGAQATVTVSNVGTSELAITSLDVVGPGGSGSHPSADDFSIAGCSSLPCNPGTRLCAPTQPGCGQSSTTFTLEYRSDDGSQTDLAELHIESNDPTNPELIVILQAPAP